MQNLQDRGSINNHIQTDLLLIDWVSFENNCSV